MAASPAAMPRAPRLAAARKLIANRDAIVADATAAAAVTQTTCRTCPSCSLSLSSSPSHTPAGAYAYTYVPANTYTDDADEPAAHQRTQSASCRPCTAPRCGTAPQIEAGLGLPPFDVFLSSLLPFSPSLFFLFPFSSSWWPPSPRGLNQAPVAQLAELHGYDCGAVEDREVQ